MLKLLKEGFLSLNLSSKFLVFLLFTLSCTNIYGFFEAYHIGSYSRAYSHAIYALTLFALNFVVMYSSLHLERGSKFYNEAKSLYGKGYEEKRMEMYEKLLEKKEKEIQ